MRRLMIIFVIGCTALGLGLGLMLNSSSPGSSNNTAARKEAPTTATTARVLAEQAVRSTTTTFTAPTVTTVTLPPTTTTTRPAVTTTTRPAHAAAKPATTPTTHKPAAAKKPAADCGTGGTTAGVTGKFDAADGLWHITVTVDNQNTKAIVLDKLVAHVEYDDSTARDIAVANAAGTKVDSGKKATFELTDSSGDAALTKAEIANGGFAFHTDGEPTACASS